MNLFPQSADGQGIVRVPPQDLHAEQAVLGSMLIEADATNRALAILQDADFYREAHRMIYRAMQAVAARLEPVDLITVGAELRRQGIDDEVGGPEYLTAVIGEVATTAHVVKYAAIVRDRAVCRSMVSLGMELAANAYEAPADPTELTSAAIQKLMELEDRLRRRGRVKHFSDLKSTAEAVLQQARERALWHRHRPHTNLDRVDRWMCGLARPGLTIIRGYQKTGKSSLARDILRHESGDHNEHAILFGAEMTKEQTIDAMVKALSGYSLHQYVHDEDKLDEEAVRVYAAFLETVLQANLTHVDAHGMTAQEVAAQWVAIHRDRPARLAVIDHFQRLTGATDSEPQARAAVQLLTNTSMDLDAACLLLSQETILPDGRRSTKGGRVLEEEAHTVLAIKRIGDTIQEGQTNPRAELLLEFSRDSQATKWAIVMTDRQTWGLLAEDEEARPGRKHRERTDKRNE